MRASGYTGTLALALSLLTSCGYDVDFQRMRDHVIACDGNGRVFDPLKGNLLPKDARAAHIQSILRTADTTANSEGAAAVGRVVSHVMQDVDNVFLQENTTAHSNSTAETIATRISHILEAADTAVDRVVHGGMIETANDTVARANGMLRTAEQAHLIEMARASMRVASEMLAEVAASNATGRAVELLDQAGVVLNETSQSLEGMLHDGVKVSLGG